MTARSAAAMVTALTALAVTFAGPADAAQTAVGATQVVSRNALGHLANRDIGAIALSDDGSTVAFDTLATNLTPDTNALSDVFVVRDGVVNRISVGTDGQEANGASTAPVLSSDGRYAAFVSAASNLVPGDFNSCPDVFRYDAQAPAGERLTRISAYDPIAAISSARTVDVAGISTDGSVITFGTDGLDPDPSDGRVYRIYQRLVATAQTVMVSLGPDAAAPPRPSARADVSADGRYVVWTGTRGRGDSTFPADAPSPAHVYWRDTVAGATEIVSRATGGMYADQSSSFATVSDDGQIVAFRTAAANLVQGDTNDANDVFVHDRSTRSTRRVSVSNQGQQAFDGANDPVLSANGRFVAFRASLYDVSNGLVDSTRILYDLATGAATSIDGFIVRPDVSSGSTASTVISGDGSLALMSTTRDVTFDGVRYLQAVLRDVGAMRPAVDTSAPTTDWTVVLRPEAVPAERPAFRAQASEAGSRLECSSSAAGPWAECGTEETGLPDGVGDVWVRAVDLAGNVDATPASMRARANEALLRAPTLTLPTMPVTQTRVKIYSEGVYRTRTLCRIDGGTWLPSCASPHFTGPLADGVHTVDVRSVDWQGVQSTITSGTFVVDTTAPVLDSPTLTVEPNRVSARIDFAAGEAVNATCAVDAAAAASCTSPFFTGTLAQGWHSVTVRATDAAGHPAAPATVAFEIDSVGADLTVQTPPAWARDTTPSFTFGTDEDQVTFTCQIDSGGAKACTSPWTAATLGQGKHSVVIRAFDRHGNASTAVTRSFVVDSVAPDTSFVSRPGSSTTDRTPSFRFAGSEHGATFTCRLDSGSSSSCTASWTTKTLAKGKHTVEVRATDRAGNVDATPAKYSFTVR